MKKIFIVALLLVACVFLLYKRSTQLIQNSMPTDTLYVFVQEGCPHCHHALDYINGTVRTTYPDLNIEVLDIADKKNSAKMFAMAQKYDLPLKRLGTPLLVLNNRTLMGWSAKHEKQLLNIIHALPAKNP